MHSRQIHTPITIGSFVIASLTGALMFFDIAPGGVRATHEWMSLLFILVVGLHIYTNKRPFLKYFSNNSLLLILASVASGMALYAMSYNDVYMAEEAFQLLTTIETSALLPLLDISHDEFVSKLSTVNITPTDNTLSLAEIAALHGLDTHEILEILITP